ncbi:Nucleolar MIF4G domain-containing protein 1 [Fasciola gigantica]|uniref:Nucleolar MIF4G domain-containing protein 1 n=1 Tax=Fasciola gigantica TaxID=46835 RepID=A0A504Y3T1_FASGI|nr:Nucleolar MIF4G domain-containing protein 1 [Fasciola gigantica]
MRNSLGQSESLQRKRKVLKLIPIFNYRIADKTDIYGQLGKVPLETDFRANSTDNKIPVDDLSSHHPFPVQSCSSNDVSSTPDSNDVLQPDVESLRRSIRIWINKVSEVQMARVVSELTNLFSDHPRASVRLTLVDELCTLLESSPVNTRSNTGWLQQELAVCIACVHISLHMKLQHDNLISYVVEKIVDTLFDQSGNFQPKMGSASLCLFLSYLYRFEVLSANLIFDIVQKLLHTGSLHELKVAHFICEAVGVNLRKANLNLCQNITQEATKLLVQCTSIQVEAICELEAIIQRLSEKRSKNEGVLRALHLKKMMRTWLKATSLPDDMCLPVCLSDILNRASAVVVDS